MPHPNSARNRCIYIVGGKEFEPHELPDRMKRQQKPPSARYVLPAKRCPTRKPVWRSLRIFLLGFFSKVVNTNIKPPTVNRCKILVCYFVTVVTELHTKFEQNNNVYKSVGISNALFYFIRIVPYIICIVLYSCYYLLFILFLF